MNCVICDNSLVFRWTDTHGVGQCCDCGVPYTIFHYENDKRVERPPECCTKAEWIPLLKRYRAETGKVIPSGCSFPGSSQELAQPSDIEAFNEWCDQHKAEVEALA